MLLICNEAVKGPECLDCCATDECGTVGICSCCRSNTPCSIRLSCLIEPRNAHFMAADQPRMLHGDRAAEGTSPVTPGISKPCQPNSRVCGTCLCRRLAFGYCGLPDWRYRRRRVKHHHHHYHRTRDQDNCVYDDKQKSPVLFL